MSMLKAFAMALAAPSLIFAQQAAGQTAQEGESKPAPPPGVAEARDGDFGLLMVAVPDIETFWEEWAQPTPPNITSTGKGRRNEPVFAVLMMANCTTDEDGRCNLSTEVTIFQPDGAVYDDGPMSLPVWAETLERRDALILLPGAVGLRVEDGEVLGTYTMTAKVTDNISGSVLTTTIALDIAEADDADMAPTRSDV